MRKLTSSAGLLAIAGVLLGSCAVSGHNAGTPPISKKWIDQKLEEAANQYKVLMRNVPEGVMPESFIDNKIKTCTAKSWVAGFFPGTLLYLYEATRDSVLYNEAVQRIKIMAPNQYNTSTHDVGFMMYCSYGNLYRITHNDKYKDILLNAARSLATRFNPKVGCIRSWGHKDDSTEFKVIIDNMMNLELLLWATKETGDSTFYKIAVSHANTTMKNHFRPDYSSYHLVIYNPETGKVMKKQTVQGAFDSSAWARGQSWGLYGYTMMYRETKDKRYLHQAQHIARFILNNPNLPADGIPYWDYNAPGIPHTNRDASAASVMASALIELAGYSDKPLAKRYMHAAATILRTLSSPAYLARTGDNGGFLLKHSVANMNKKVEVDAPSPYADYYYVEAMLRYKKALNR